MTNDFRHVDVKPMSPALGAEIYGVDLNAPSEQQFAELRRAYLRYGVIFFREQQLSPEQHIRFARRWGEINVNRFFTPVAGHPQIAEVRKEPQQKTNLGNVWHSDHSYDQIPALGSVLYALEVPDQGGDTLFASMSAAYQALSEGLQQTLLGLRALHSSRHVFGVQRHRLDDGLNGRLGNPEQATQDAVHPVVLRHPESGRLGLYVNPSFTVRFDGWSEQESRPLLEYLYRHIERPEFQCRFRWRKGSLALWDNRATWHYAVNDYPGQRRLMHRITIEGTPLV